MAKEVDKSAEADQPTKPADTSVDGGDATEAQVETDQARLSQSVWFGENATGDTSLQPAVRQTGTTASDGNLDVTPIQSVLTTGAEAPAADTATPVAETPVVAETVEVPETPKGSPEVVELAQAVEQPAEETVDERIERLRRAVLEADEKAPEALKALVDGRGKMLDLVRSFVSTETAGNAAGSDQAVNSLREQELRQGKEYVDFLAPGTTRTNLGVELIARGDDASIREGERQIVEAIQTRPDIIFHPNFRAQLMDAYTKMAETRKANGLGPWDGEINIAGLTKSAGEQPAADKSGEHFAKANEIYWDKGVKEALPEFQNAIAAADQTAGQNQNGVSDRRLMLFVEGLKADRAIAQGVVNGESTTEMEKRRDDIWNRQVENYVEDSVGSRARMNAGLALVASGDPEMLKQGQQYLLDAVGKHPGLIYSPGLANFSNQFTESMFGAYKANVEKSPAQAPATTDGAQTGLGPDVAAPVDINAGYDKGTVTDVPLPTDKKVEGYGWDTATDIGLPIATFGLMLVTGRMQYKRFQQARAERAANFAMEPLERAGQAEPEIVRRQGANGEERFELKGRAQDGQIVAKNLTPGSETSASNRPPVDLPADFDPRKGKFGEYTPVKVDSKEYLLNAKGEAFEQRRGKLYPTDAIRGLTTQEVAAQELNSLPRDMQRTSFDLHGRTLTPLGTLADGRVVLENSTTGGAPMRDMIKVPDGVDPFKGEFKDFQHQRIAGRDYFISPDSKVYTMLQPERRMMEVQGMVVTTPEAVYKATGMPGSSAEERALNKQVNEILEPLRIRLRSGEQVDAATKAEYLNRARDVLMPAAKEVAKAQGLPESVINENTFRFAEMDTRATHNTRTGEITLSIFGDNHVTAIDHEVKHKQRSLDMIAAAEADPKGFRDAILDRSLADIGKPGRRFTESGIDSRPRIENPKAAEAMRDMVRAEVMAKLAERGDIPFSQVPADKPIPQELLSAFGGDAERVKLEVQRETQNFLSLEKQNTQTRAQLDEAGQRHVEQRVQEFKAWQAAGTTDGVAPSLRNNPDLKVAIDAVAVDTLGTHQRSDPSLRPYYRFSSDEIAARREQSTQALRRLEAELKAEGGTRTVGQHPEGRNLIERQQIADLQQNLLTELNNGNTEKAKEQAQELLRIMSASEPERYVEDIRFLQEQELLTRDQTKGTKFETMLEAPRPVAQESTSFDRIAALDDFPVTTGNGNNDRFLTLERLKESLGPILGSRNFKADAGQVNVYNLLANPNPEVGVLAKLIKEGSIKGDWAVYPTEQGSPADKVGADYILVNRETGEFHFLDATKNPDKSNVFRMREQGVIVYKSQFFERLGGELIEPNDSTRPSAIEQEAREFKSSLEQRIIDLTSQPSQFNLKTTPMPDVVRVSGEQSQAQIDRLANWASDESRRRGEGSSGDFADMAERIRAGALEHEVKVSKEVSSPDFDQSVRRQVRREVSRFVALGREYTGSPSAPRADVDVKAHNGSLKFTEGGEIYVSPKLAGMLNQERLALLQKPIEVINALDAKELRSLFKPLLNDSKWDTQGAKKMRQELIRLHEGGDRTIKRVLEGVQARLYERATIEAGGAVGREAPVIERNIIRNLRSTKPDELLNRTAEKPKAEAPILSPAETFAKELPKAALELREGLKNELPELKLRATADEYVGEWMREMLREAERNKTWSAEEQAKFKTITEKYQAGDAATIQQVHEWLNGTDRVNELSDGRAQTPRVEIPSPVGMERIGNYRDLLAGLNGLSREQYLGEVVKKAQTALAPDVAGRRNRLAFTQTNMQATETESLKPGESELVFRRGTEVFKATSFDGTGEPSFVTADGTKVPVKETTVELRVGKGTAGPEAAREALVRSHELAALIDGKAKPQAQAVAEAQALRRSFDGTQIAGSSDAAGQSVADKVVTLGEFEFSTRRQSVDLTRTGVKFGSRGEVPYETLVRDTLRDKRTQIDRLEQEKLRTANAELDGQIETLRRQVADLEQLAKDITKPESIKQLMDAIQKHATPEEVARLKAEQGKGRAGETVKATIVRGGSYALVAAFVAGMLVSSSSSADAAPIEYAPTNVR